ncbi:MAG: stage V sporulation protein R, partial [Firmicutes bacterium]|nr:stage V sporulation protein R [Bacillota bacterium]
VRDGIVASRTNGGYPVIHVVDGDYRRAGELYLRHAYEGVELDVRYTEKTLPFAERLWGRPVHLETVRDGRSLVFRCEGGQVTRRDAAT